MKGLLVLLFCAAALAVVSAQSTFYVDGTNGNDNNDGTSDSPFKTIGKAINTAGGRNVLDTTIAVRPGTYSGVDNSGLEVSQTTNTAINKLTFKNDGGDDVIIDGSGINTPFLSCSDNDYLEVTISEFSFQNFQSSHSILDFAGISKAFLNLVTVHNSGAGNNGNFSAVNVHYCDYLSIENSRFSEIESGGMGSALHVEDTPGDILQTLFLDNTANKGDGGAVWLKHSRDFPQFTQCNFTNNRATQGGAISAVRGAGALKLFIYDSVFMDNHASTSGGAIYTNAAPQITGCVFNSNIANGEAGGAIALDEPDEEDVYIGVSTFTSNSAPSGGALSIRATQSVVVDQCDFNTNTATAQGGAILLMAGQVDITKGTFIANIAYWGGAVATNYTGAHLSLAVQSNTLFMENSGTNGGALYISPDTALYLVSDSTFSNNDATYSGGGAYLLSTGLFQRVTFTSNSAVTGAGVYAQDASGIVFNRVTMKRNLAASTGAGYYGEGYTFTTFYQSVFSDNVAGNTTQCSGLGGAVALTNILFPTEFDACTFDGNYACKNGNDVWFHGESRSRHHIVRIRECTFVEAFHLDEFSSSISGNKALFVVHGSSARNMPMVDLQSNSSLSLCETGLEGAHLTKGITMTSSGFLITDSNLRIGGDMTWTDGVIGYQATEDCVRGADHSHVQDTQTSPYYLMTNTIVNISSHVEGATLTLDGLGWKNSAFMTMTNVTVSLGFNDFHAESHSVLELNGDSQIHAGTVYINDDGTLILNGENFVFGNLVFEDHSDLIIMYENLPLNESELSKVSGHVNIKGGSATVELKSGDQLGGVGQRYEVLGWGSFEGSFKGFALDSPTHTGGKGFYQHDFLFVEVAKSNSSAGMGAGGIIGIILGLLVLVALVGGAIYYYKTQVVQHSYDSVN